MINFTKESTVRCSLVSPPGLEHVQTTENSPVYSTPSKEIVSSLKLRNSHSKDFGLHLSSGIFACCLRVNQRIISITFMTRFCGWMKICPEKFVLVSQSCLTLCDHMDCVAGLCPRQLLCPWNSPGKNTGVGVVTPFSRGSSWPRHWTQVSCTAGRFFTVWATEKTRGWGTLCFILKGWVLGQTMLAMGAPQFSVSLNSFPFSNIWRGEEISCHHTETSTAYHKNVAVVFQDTAKEKSSLEKWSVCPVLRLPSLLIWIWILKWPRIIQLPFKCC